MNTDIVVLSDEREKRAAQVWELADLEPPVSLTIAARIAELCLSSAKRKAKLVAQEAPWEVKHTESLNIVAKIVGFDSWREFQTYAKQWHTLAQDQWRADVVSLRMVSACWALSPKQQMLPAAQSLLSRKLNLDVPGVSPAKLNDLVRTVMCVPTGFEEHDEQDLNLASIGWARSHYRERFANKIAEGIDPEPYRINAAGMLAKMAPTLPQNVILDLVNYCIGGPHTALLAAYESWMWPQADVNDRLLWGSGHLHAADQSIRLQSMLEGTKFSRWLLDSAMTDLRRWQNTFLTGRKGRSRWEIAGLLFDSFREGQKVPDGIFQEFADWRQAVKAELVKQQELSRARPVPHHLRYLAEMTMIRLDALFDHRDPTDREYRAAGVAAILKAAAERPKLPKASTIAEEICPAEMRNSQILNFAYASRLTNVLSTRIQGLIDQPGAMKRFTTRWKLDKAQITFTCKHCNSRSSVKPVSEKVLPPFVPHCYCRNVRWKSSVLEREKDEHFQRPYDPEECIGFPEYFDELMWWALHRWLGLPNTPEFPKIAASLLQSEVDRGSF